MPEQMTPETKFSNVGTTRKIIDRESAVIRFAGDSGDGMQLVGEQFTNTSALAGEFFATLPDYPSEIRAPAGTLYGVSGFQICIGSSEVYTPGDQFDVLLAMNPAAYKVNLANVKEGGIIIANEDSFIDRNLTKANYLATENPLADAKANARYRILRVPMSTLTKKALEGQPLTGKEADRCKNFFALGILYGLFQRDPSYTLGWIKKKFASKPNFMEANICALNTGIEYAAKTADLPNLYRIPKSTRAMPEGIYRNVTGNQAAALGLMAAAQKAGLKLFLGSYPITPATDIMHELAKYPDYATVFQAEDEIAAMGSTVGAAFGGALAATNTSGPGFSLKLEMMGLGVIAELPMVIINVQRCGPSTGLPTKTEQADLMQAMYGRHGESPVVVMAATSPKDCFDMAVEASRIALKYMTPVVLLTEGYLGNGSEVWKVPGLNELPAFPVTHHKTAEGYRPYNRNPETLARPWAIPGTPGMTHRLGGLEKEDGSGAVSHDAINHEKMTAIRAEKVARVVAEIPPMEVYGHPQAELLVLGWGSTAGVIKHSVRSLSSQGVKVACAQVKFLNPFPKDLEALLGKYKKVLVPENNSGQLWRLLRSELLINTEKMNKIQGQPFRIDEIENKIKNILGVKL